MSVWQRARARRTVAGAALVAAMALTLSACGGDSKEEKPKADRSAQQNDQGKQDGQASKPKQSDDAKVIATLQGRNGIVLDITSATRSAGGFVTVNGNLKNTSDRSTSETQEWTGPELDVIRGVGGSSLGGATLVDEKEKKRYYTLRDTENRPLASAGLGTVAANSTQKVFMQFPAPPKSTTQVALQIPTFQAAALTLTDG
ncbi:hypothetical protein [Streptomyces hiroshimensis]|uniref:Lipoprotein n=1 Tax=Streptomyces hiroshimensis TaxID=66424 RepID=A0ABQ2YNN9_9ACTN|nr:hypothetical protein [Streptomyces hiroshimensis]GGX89425.1 hypothetical protein GCM10010324_38800 [Streptomyces hiroshimensis]